MPMDVDRYPSIGAKREVASIEDAERVVRGRWPKATAEGSTGMERTWLIDEPAGRRIIAHHWVKWGRAGAPDRVFMRVAVDSRCGIWADDMSPEAIYARIHERRRKRLQEKA